MRLGQSSYTSIKGRLQYRIRYIYIRGRFILSTCTYHNRPFVALYNVSPPTLGHLRHDTTKGNWLQTGHRLDLCVLRHITFWNRTEESHYILFPTVLPCLAGCPSSTRERAPTVLLFHWTGNKHTKGPTSFFMFAIFHFSGSIDGFSFSRISLTSFVFLGSSWKSSTSFGFAKEFQ